MSSRHAVYAIAFVVAAMFGIGCANDDMFDPHETIVFENRTGVNSMACSVDNEFVASVNDGENLVVEGDYEGDRLLSVTIGGRVVSRTEHIDDGKTLVWTLTH